MSPKDIDAPDYSEPFWRALRPRRNYRSSCNVEVFTVNRNDFSFALKICAARVLRDFCTTPRERYCAVNEEQVFKMLVTTIRHQ